MNKSSIDFVVTWVDGADPVWLRDFLKHTSSQAGDKRISRYRNWENLKYLFRGMERFAPWHNKLFFVTYGHVPSWLNLECEKLVVVRHEEIINNDCLPVFSANPIEINLHRISGLSEKFVYFNDDTFLLKSIKEDRFFKNNLPCDVFSFNALSDSMIAHIKLNDIQMLHKYFDKSRVVKNNFFKIFNLKVGLLNFLKTVLLIPWPKMTGFYDHHLAQPYLKNTFEEVWKCESETLKKTEQSRIRSHYDVNQYLFRYWQLCTGKFTPVRLPRHHVDWIRNYEDSLLFSKEILSQKNEMVCINDDVGENQDFEKIKNAVNSAFQEILPEKSCYEL